MMTRGMCVSAVLVLSIIVILGTLVACANQVDSESTIELDSPLYDSTTGILYYSGSAPAELVNIRVYDKLSNQPVSDIDATLVINGRFGGSFNVGFLNHGIYTLTASANNLSASKDFHISSEVIVIENASYGDGFLSYNGTTNAPLINAVLYGDDYQSNIIASIPDNNSGYYSESVFLGSLNSGVYTLRLTGVYASNTMTVVVGGIDTYTEFSSYSDDGKTLLAYNGRTDEYVLPSNIEKIANGAFDHSNIKKFVLTKDVEWDIVVKDEGYPLEIAGVQTVEIRDGVTSVPDYLFAKTGIASITIPSSVRSIGNKSFYGCENLSSVVFDSDSHIENIGSYAFSFNKKLTTVVFGSSEDGYQCSFEKGSFSGCNLNIVRLSEEFNLYSIGDAAFSKNPVFSLLIGDESGNTIHIPGTVGYLGQSAFSNNVNYTDKRSEPSANTFSSFGAYTYSDYTHPGGGNALLFDENNQLMSIEQNCFAGLPLTSIDLSRCTNLQTIGAGAFNGSLQSGNANILFPVSLVTIERGAFYSGFPVLSASEKNSSLVLPATVQFVGENAFFGVLSEISFTEGSDLRIFESPSYTRKDYTLIDLSNCLNICELGSITSPVKLPRATFIAKYNIGGFALDDTPVATINNDELNISSDTVALVIVRNNNGSLSGFSENTVVNCSDNNTFSFSSGKLYCDNGVTKSLIYTKAEKVLSITSESGTKIVVKTGAIYGNTKTIEIPDNNVIIEPGAFQNCTRLSTIIIKDLPTEWSIHEVFEECGPEVNYYIPASAPYNDVVYLNGKGNTYLGYSIGDTTIYVPGITEDGVLVWEKESSDDGSLTAIFHTRFDLTGSYDIVSIGAKVSIRGQQIVVSNLDTSMPFIQLTAFKKVSFDNQKYTVIFDGNGGVNENGEESTIMELNGGSILEIEYFPNFSMNCHNIVGWIDQEGREVKIGELIKSDMIIKPVWVERPPVIHLDTGKIPITVNGCHANEVVNASELLVLEAEVKEGFELLMWLVDGNEVSSAKEPLVLSNIQDDVLVSVSYIYVSSSSGLNVLVDSDLPTTDEISQFVKSYEVGGYIDKTESAWVGTVSTPLVVDNYVYLRIADSLYKIESDTGFIIKKVESNSISTFYHYLGYGDGKIVDYNTSRVYDLDLNQLYVLDRSIRGADYYNGVFYTSGSDIYAFSAVDEDPHSTEEIKHLEKIGVVTNAYSSYGFSRSCFNGDYMYRVTADGVYRGIGAINLKTGVTTYKDLTSLRSVYLDDGWISYYNGYIFLTGYTEGLFGAVAKSGSDILAYVSVDDFGTFGNEKYIEFNRAFTNIGDINGFSSQFLVAGGRGFVDVGGLLFVFDLPSDWNNLNLSNLNYRVVDFAFTHGSIILNVSHIQEEGSPIYVYGIPYDSNYGDTLKVAVDVGGTLRSYTIYSAEKEWNSQAIRSDIDGRMLWYNDSGWLYSYTTSDKNVYYFFIEDGDSAIWYKAYGANAADALASLGDSVATLNAAKIIQTVNGHFIADGMTLQMLKATYGTTDNNGQFNNLDQYSWVNITNLGDTSYSLNHYFRIICGNGSSVSSGDLFTYMDGGEIKTYIFADNIGDRSIIGKQLSRGTDVVYIRFVEDNTEIPGTASIVKRGSEAKVHFPEVVKVGYIPIWKNASGEEVADIYGQTFSSDATFYLSWQELPAGYIISGTMDVSDGVTTWSVDVDIRTGVGTTDGLSIKVTAVTSDGRVLTDIKTTGTNGLASGSLNAANIRLMYIRIVDEHVEGNLGYVMIEREATA